MSYSHLLVERAGHLAEVTINRPDKLNALNREVIDQLSACMKALDGDNDVRCILLTGAGEKAFVAGADISEALGKIYGGKSFSIDSLQNDPRERLTLVVTVDSPVAIADLCAVA